MKRIRNTGIYYAVFGVLLMISFIFTNLWKISIVGVLLLLIYFFLKFVYKKKKIDTKLTKKQLQLWDLFLVVSPFIYVALTTWYVWRPYKQIVILSKNYEGVIAIQYDKPNGQLEKWTGGFLGIGTSRLIKVDSTGIVETQFKFHHNAIPFLGAKQTYHNRGGLKIYYENNLDKKINLGWFDGENMDKYLVNESEMKNLSNIYFTGFDYYPLMIFVITKPKDYHKYFMTKEEMINEYKIKHNQEPSPARFSNVRILNNKYSQYYKLQEYYHKN